MIADGVDVLIIAAIDGETLTQTLERELAEWKQAWGDDGRGRGLCRGGLYPHRRADEL